MSIKKTHMNIGCQGNSKCIYTFTKRIDSLAPPHKILRLRASPWSLSRFHRPQASYGHIHANIIPCYISVHLYRWISQVSMELCMTIRDLMFLKENLKKIHNIVSFFLMQNEPVSVRTLHVL